MDRLRLFFLLLVEFSEQSVQTKAKLRSGIAGGRVDCKVLVEKLLVLIGVQTCYQWPAVADNDVCGSDGRRGQVNTCFC